MDIHIINNSLGKAISRIILSLCRFAAVYTIFYLVFPNFKSIYIENSKIIIGGVSLIIAMLGLHQYRYYERNLKFHKLLREIKDKKIELERIVLYQETIKEIINKKIQFYNSLAPTSAVIFISGILVDNNFKFTNELSNKNIIVSIIIFLLIVYILRINFLYREHDEICIAMNNVKTIIVEKYNEINNY